MSLILKSFLPSQTSPAKELRHVIGPCFFRLAESGRSLLTALLLVLKKQVGKQRIEVLVPAYTCYSVAAAIVKAGLTISVYDLDPQSFNPDLETLQKAASEKTLAILSQHLFGIPAAVAGVAKIAKATGAFHIEDAAQALGGFGDSQPLGMTGDFGLFSFGRGKPLPLGAGGMLTAKNNAFIGDMEPLPETKNFSRLALAAVSQLVSQPMLYGIAEALPLKLGQTHFDPGFRIAGIPTLIRRLLTNALPGLEGMNAHRRNIGEVYRRSVRPGLLFDESPDGVSVYTRFPLRVQKNVIPLELKQRGVRRMYPRALVDEEKIRPYISQRSAAVSGARQIAASLVTLPTHLGINEQHAVLTSGRINDLMIH